LDKLSAVDCERCDMPDQQTDIPDNWDRTGLPGWSYSNEELFALETDLLFQRHWQLACHVSDLPQAGSYITFDIGPERALILRDREGQIRAFHNLCRHRGSRVVSDDRGVCKHALTCPFHGWTFNLDGTLRAAARPASLPELDPVEWGLKPVEMDIWHGFIFVRFQPGPQDSIASVMHRFETEVAPYNLASMQRVEGDFIFAEAAVNWKSMRDVDNEGYHVAKAHPSLQDLYGKTYFDESYVNGTTRSLGKFNPSPSKLWSVKSYRSIVDRLSHLPEPHNAAWLYLGIFPNAVIGLYPDSVIFYQEVPVGPKYTLQRGAVYRHADETREMRAARYLSGRIDGLTADEDLQLTKWTDEAPLSSGFDGVILSDLEYGVRSFHDQLRTIMPVLDLEVAPPVGTLAEQNDVMKGR
jgi:phenylpropionate dioxygenase-like ring-hydroxylating dioxygenase large terminal subunit